MSKALVLPLAALCGLGTALYFRIQGRAADIAAHGTAEKGTAEETGNSGAPAHARSNTKELRPAALTTGAFTDDARAGPIAFTELAAWAGTYDLAAGWGISWADVDGDGDLDLFIANHMHYPSALYLNEGGVRFRRAEGDLGRAVGLDDHFGAWADFDRDGDQDLFTANGYYRPDRLMLNTGTGQFEDGTEQWGLVLGDKGRGRSAMWADLNGDSWLDLYVLNLYSPDVYYQREPGGTFREAGAQARIVNSLRKDGASAGDVDGDGDIDLYIPLLQPRQRNLLLLNRGDGVFIERAQEAGVDLEGGSSNCAMGDYDGDGDLDLYVTRGDHRGDVLFRNRGDGTFEDATAEAGIAVISQGIRNAGFTDFDNDGWLDIYVSCGGPYDGPNAANALYRNLGDGTFEELAEQAGATAIAPGNSAAIAFADYNLDGFVDIAATNGGGARAISGPHQLFRNSARGGNWLRIAPRGRGGNPDGIGARVRVLRPDGAQLVREAGAIRTMGQDDPFVYVGLGPETHALSVEVHWPSGGSARRQGVPAGETLWIEETSPARHIASHPAALLGQVPTFDTAELASALQAQGLQRLPAADESDLAARCEQVLARALATELLGSIDVGAEEFESARAQLASAAAIPARYYVEQVGVGSFTTMRKKPKLPWDVAKKMGRGMRKRGAVLELMLEHGVRAWARRRRKESTRGYLEEGWLTEPMLRERYGEHASAIIALSERQVLGPLPLREGRDVQDPERVWPILRLFRMVAKAEPTAALPEPMSSDLQRSLVREKGRAALRAAEAEVTARPGPTAGIGMLSYDISKLAAAARARGIEQREEVRSALERARLEARLDRGVRELLQQREPSQEMLERYVAAHASEWNLPIRLRGTQFYFPKEERAIELQALFAAGRSTTEAIEALDIPPITDPKARNVTHYEQVTMDASTWSRATIEGRFEELVALAPGAAASIHTSGEGFIMFVLEQRLPAQPWQPQAAQERARYELVRAQSRAFVDELLQR